jgi:hypothetical protein
MEVDDDVAQVDKEAIHDHIKLWAFLFLLNYFSYASFMIAYVIFSLSVSSQFDPAPRDESWHKSPRTPDYFLWSMNIDVRFGREMDDGGGSDEGWGRESCGVLILGDACGGR